MERGEKSDTNVEGDSGRENGRGGGDGLDGGGMLGEDKGGLEDRMDSDRGTCDGILSILW